MATITRSISQPIASTWRRINLNLFIQDHITKTWYLTVWLLILTGINVWLIVDQFNVAPLSTLVIVIAWLIGLTSVILGEVRHQHTSVSRWLKNNLLSSITNTLLTLILVLGLWAAIRGFWDYAVVRATFETSLTAPEFRTPETGASWGVIAASWKLLTTGTLPEVHLWRVEIALWFIIAMSMLSLIAFRPRFENQLKVLRRILIILWLLSPFALYIFLAGLRAGVSLISFQTLLGVEVALLAFYGLLYWQRVVKFSWRSFAVWALAWPIFYVIWRLIARSGTFPVINVDTWGGFLFTMIISVFAIIVSFPLGVALALGRRSTVRGIPGWITWPAGIGATIWGLATSTPGLLEAARNNVEQIIAFWPLLILLATYLFQRLFKGNVVAAASTIYIEVVRGVPLITVLFMAIIMAPLFFPAEAIIKNAWAVMVGFTLFTAAYLAENVRGGLQAIPNGQYEAADAIGLNGLQKMRFIILPQALRAVIPAIVGLFIGIFKDSSLVAVVGLFDLLGIIGPIISNPQWLGLRRELYFFAAFVYFIGSFAMSWYSRRLETQLGVGER